MRRAVVVGAGHNGLVAAAYLARGGLQVVVCERRGVLGGATVTEELAPGFWVSSASYSFGLFRPDIFADLELGRRGVVLYPKDPQMYVPLEGGGFYVWRDPERTRQELARIHPPDADAYPRWCAFWEEAAARLLPLVESPDPPPPAAVQRELGPELWRLAVAGSAAETVSAFFAAPEVQGAFASQGVIGTRAGPRDAGTAWVMAYHALGGELCGARGTWASLRGGMGSLARALAEAAEEAGAELRPGCAVESVVVEGGAARGVVLAGGEVLDADVVVSGADPVTTFLRLVPAGALPEAFEERVRAWRVPGSAIKVNLALAEAPDLPPQALRGTIEVAPSVDYIQAAFEEACRGRVSSEPWMEVFVPSAADPTVAPPGCHVLSAFAQWSPQGPWDAEAARGAVLQTIARYAPNVPRAVVACEVLGPVELEERFGLAGGNIFHGEMLPDQCFGARFDYRTPLAGLYLCGSGARPGGAVMGVAGRNAARAVLEDLGA